MTPDENKGPGNGNGNADAGDRPQETRRANPTQVVRYGAMNWVGEFSYRPQERIATGRKLVVQTDRGIELGEQVSTVCDEPGCPVRREQVQSFVQNSGPDFCLPRAGRVLRVANDQDLNEHRHLNAHIREDIDYCAETADRLGLDLKVVTAEHLLGGERIVFYFRAPARVDFRQLVKELAQRYRTRIEMRQVGARDEARLVADYEICGRECCCKNFLKKLRPVNMKMAKLQKSTLDPSKVSGRCGRLRCCLRYEHIGYEELLKRLPRTNSRVMTEAGPGTVLDRQILTQLVLVRLDDDRIMSIPLEEIKEFNLPPATRRKEEAPAETTEPPDESRKGRSRRRRRRSDKPGGQRDRADEPRKSSDDAPPPPRESRFRADAPDAPDAGGETPAGPTGGADDGSGKGERRRKSRRRRRRKPGKDQDAAGGDAGTTE